jgi:hypothetical protein
VDAVTRGPGTLSVPWTCSLGPKRPGKSPKWPRGSTKAGSAHSPPLPTRINPKGRGRMGNAKCPDAGLSWTRGTAEACRETPSKAITEQMFRCSPSST